jgi:uncharacterized peroxidase-related enzyme
MSFLTGLPEQADLWDVIRAREDLWKFTIPASETIMRGPSPLSIAERELIASYVSGLNACSYCFDAHSATVRALGYSEEITEALLEDPSKAPIDEKLKPVLSFVRKLTNGPSKIVKSDVTSMSDAGWDDDAISSVIAVASWFNFVNRWVFAHGCELRDDILAMWSLPTDMGREEMYESYLSDKGEHSAG